MIPTIMLDFATWRAFFESAALRMGIKPEQYANPAFTELAYARHLDPAQAALLLEHLLTADTEPAKDPTPADDYEPHPEPAKRQKKRPDKRHRTRK